MKHLSFLTVVAALAFTFTGCGEEATIVEPDQAVESVELSPEEQAEYDKEMAAQMGN
ncbi:hypothetical protein LOC71_07430 [Rhodopirellula sp. JC740]|uniref:Secreted protein n=1 Tax=Rhodopirellula halodulae TaxID=2894198 RepID=A0ABS8NEW8_9BACT|nr:hypothetical protein [Rhodopirellula sp. JC740]MCC9642100.1 hypothetical protein [Rhodopirellula sp. JC740]